jgi:hypothetical protein
MGEIDKEATSALRLNRRFGWQKPDLARVCILCRLWGGRTVTAWVGMEAGRVRVAEELGEARDWLGLGVGVCGGEPGGEPGPSESVLDGGMAAAPGRR